MPGTLSAKSGFGEEEDSSWTSVGFRLDASGEPAIMHSMRIAIPVFPGVEELDAIAPLEVFGVAKETGLDLTVELITASTASTVRCFHGMEISGLRQGSGTYDLIIVPGGGWISGSKDGVRLAMEEGLLPKMLRKQYEKGATIASVCTGTFLLLAAGLLDGIPATTHHSAMEDLKSAGVQAVSSRVVDAGCILTSGGIASGLDLSLWILERTFGKDEADRVAEILEYERRGGILHHP